MPFWKNLKDEPDKTNQKVEKDCDIRKRYDFREVLGT